MSTIKMKGLFKGLKYISHIFEEEKEQEIEIGLPTDVKHVAHIGWDGPSVDASPSWMKEFTPSNLYQSAPLGSPTDHREKPEIKWVSEDSRRGNRASNSPRGDLPDLPKSSRRSCMGDNNASDSPRKKEKSRQSRRSKDSSDGGSVRSSRRQKESSEATGSPAQTLPDIPKKSRRKKSKDSLSNDGSSRSRSKGGPSSDPFSDLGPDQGSTMQARSSQLSHASSIDD